METISDNQLKIETKFDPINSTQLNDANEGENNDTNETDQLKVMKKKTSWFAKIKREGKEDIVVVEKGFQTKVTMEYGLILFCVFGVHSGRFYYFETQNINKNETQTSLEIKRK